MKDLMEFARPEVRSLKPCIHGGEVWEFLKDGQNRSKIIDFSANVNPLGPSPLALNVIKENLWRIPYYPDPNATQLKMALSKYIGNIEPKNIVLGNGSTELIYLFTDVFLERGDEVLIPQPTFGEYERASVKSGGRVRFVEAGRDLRIDVEKVLNEINSRTKIIFLCNPNNPTGRILSRRELEKVVDEAYRRGVLVFLDEDFIEFVPDHESYTLAAMVNEFTNLFIIRSFTKSFALTGLRIGYGIACEEMIELISNGKIPWNINTLAELAALASLSDTQYLKKTYELIKRERSYLYRELRRIGGLRPYPTDANFILIDTRGSGLAGNELKEKLLNYNVLIRDCRSFRGLDEYYIRVSVRTRDENRILIESLKRCLNE
ncbi:MAG: threonine-phosphate decarboxylase CobD [Nitrososphaerota archaeon]|nr:threonine-phosphate decarboxylase CobD [Nitrososphaerales archaeon]MDW8045276.1 threonine-phosphate decarboxylase CobD [Nitrososphaerota archaeon]